MDVGTGWYHHDAILLYLMGDYKIYLFEVEDKSRFVYIANYLDFLKQNIEMVLPDSDLPEGSVDFMISNCVINHIQPEILLSELRGLRYMLHDVVNRNTPFSENESSQNVKLHS
jgi:hypothetical protein